MAFNKSLAGYFDDLAHVGILTDDLQTTIAFWEKLGFKKQACLTPITRVTRWSS